MRVTYKKAQMLYKERYGKTIKTCWIADVLSKHKKTKRKASNRLGTEPKYPCPDNVLLKLEKILRELNMIWLAPTTFTSLEAMSEEVKLVCCITHHSSDLIV